MSKSIDISNLRPEIARFGTNPYLLTRGDDGRSHAVAVTIEWHEDSIKLVEILMQFRLCLRKEYSRICHFVSLLPGTA